MKNIIKNLTSFLKTAIKTLFIVLPSLYIFGGILYYQKWAEILELNILRWEIIFLYSIYEVLWLLLIIFLGVLGRIFLYKLKDSWINLKDWRLYFLPIFFLTHVFVFIYLSYFSSWDFTNVKDYSTKVTAVTYNVFKYEEWDFNVIKNDIGIMPDIIFLQEVYSKKFKEECKKYWLDCFISEYDKDVAIASKYKLVMTNESISWFGWLDNSVSGYFIKDSKKICFATGHILNPTVPWFLDYMINKAENSYERRKSQFDNLIDDVKDFDSNCSLSLIAWDLNTTPNDFRIKEIKNLWFEEFTTHLKTYPLRFPLLKIDYIFVKDWVKIDDYSLRSVNSDHVWQYIEVWIK